MNTINTSDKDVKIARGIVIRVWNTKRAITAFVRVSKKRSVELNLLKTSAFFQNMTLNEERRDVTVFRTKLASFADRDTFIKEATEAAHAVGVGIEDVNTMKAPKAAKKAELVNK